MEDQYKAHFTYPDDISVADKIKAVATRIYGADGVNFAPGVLTQIRKAEEEGYRDYPVCIAKTQYSFSDSIRSLTIRRKQVLLPLSALR